MAFLKEEADHLNLDRKTENMCVEHVGRLILNEVILPMNDHAVRVSENSIRLVVVSGASDAQSYLFRVKTATEAELLLSKMNGLIIKEKEKA